MKKIIASVIASVVVGVFGVRVFAAPSDSLTDKQSAAIVSQCTEIIGSLGTLQESDALLRYNRGNAYLTIADKLMTPLNQRIASNQLDGSELVKTAASYRTQYTDFFESYRRYENSLTELIETDCRKDPKLFYDRLSEASDLRKDLHDSSVKMVELAEEYKSEFEKFREDQEGSV